MLTSSKDEKLKKWGLSTFAKPYNIAVIGANGGIGGALIQTLSKKISVVFFASANTLRVSS